MVSSAYNDDYQIFTHVLHDHYTPEQFMLIQWNYRGMAYNSMIKKVQEYAKKMIEYCYLQLSAYRTNNILIPYGDDFSHTNATETYTFFNELKTQIDLIQKYAHSEDNPETVFDKY